MAKTYDPMVELHKRVAGRRQKEFAEEAGVSRSYLSEVVAGQKGMNDAILKALGLERVYIKRKAEKP